MKLKELLLTEMADEDDIKEYRWETGYERTWYVIKSLNLIVQFTEIKHIVTCNCSLIYDLGKK